MRLSHKIGFFHLLTALTITVIAPSPAGAHLARKTELESPAVESLRLLKEVLHRYQAAKGIKSQIERTVTISMLDQTKVSHGEISLSKGQVRLDIDPPDQTTIVFDKKLVWVMTPTPQELGGRPQVLKVKTSAIDRQSQAPIALLLGDEKAWDLFKVASNHIAGNTMTIDMKKKKKSDDGVQKIHLILDLKNKTIQLLSYSDDLDNLTSFKFSKTDFSAKLSSKLFSFSPPANAEITEIN